MGRIIRKGMIFLERLSKIKLWSVCLILIFLSGVVDYATGTDVSVTVLYLFPIILASRFLGPYEGIAVSLASAVVFVLADLLSRHTYIHPIIHYWNGISIISLFAVVAVMSMRLRSEALLQRSLARVDFLTGISNRRAFMESALAEILRSKRELSPLTAAYLDIDCFKKLNDLQGHDCGDAVLKQVAVILKSNLRATDTVARLGGDEFAFLLPDTQPHMAKKVIQKIHYALNGMARSNGWPVSFSMGAATLLKAPVNPDAFLQKADELMYSAKRDGGSTFVHETIRELPALVQKDIPALNISPS